MDSKRSLILDPAKAISLKDGRFGEMLIKANDLDGGEFEEWIFCHGMLFNSPDKWWGDHGRRDFPHEGIDLCLYKDRSQRICRLDENSRIPVLHDGVVRAMFKDYLGQAVIVEHGKSAAAGGFISFYAHTKPRIGIEVGRTVKAGEIIATIADTRHSKANILPHLHLSIGIPSASFSYEGLVWNTIRKPDMMTLLDPLSVLDGPYRALEAGHHHCREI